MSARRYDALVVGGGPAGAATAIRLQRGGLRVLLLDRARFPRPKPCGDCLNPAAVDELAALGALERVLAEPHTALSGWEIEAQDGTAFAAHFPVGRQGIAMNRTRFDAVLLRIAAEEGAEVRCGMRVADLLFERGRTVGVRLADGREVRGSLTVGADGLRSVVVRRLGLLARGPVLRKVAITGHVRGSGGLHGAGSLRLTPSGCVGVAEVEPGLLNVVIVVGGAEAARVAGQASDYFDATVATLPGLGGVLRVGRVLTTGPFDWPVRSAVAPGALLVGDAAGYFDPFTGQGIYRALHGAALAAAVAIPALRDGDVSASRLSHYERARRRAFLPGERLQRIIERVVSRPRVMGVAARRLRGSPAVAAALVAVTGDLDPVGSLARPRLLADLFRVSGR